MTERLELKSLRISGFKSFAARDRATEADQTVEFGDVTVLLGANGAGKSNVVATLALLRAAADGRLHEYVDLHGGSSLLHFGPSWTKQMIADARFEKDGSNSVDYHLTLGAGVGDSLRIVDESWGITHGAGATVCLTAHVARKHPARDDIVREASPVDENEALVAALLRDIACFQFHDTSASSEMRRGGYIEDCRQLRGNGGNLAAFLLAMRANHPEHYQRVRRTIQQGSPSFDDFVLGPSVRNPDLTLLNWRSHHADDCLMRPDQLSDGTLRFMALATLLLQPTDSLPHVVVLDEPELGLHPTAIALLAAMIGEAAHRCQVIVATQSPTLVDHFELSTIRPMSQSGGATRFLSLDVDDLSRWLEDYSLGEMWQKNLFGAGPEHG